MARPIPVQVPKQSDPHAQKIITYLEHCLYCTYALQVKVQIFHWNVEGPLFKPLHELFEKQYEDLFEAVDVLAERIRAKGGKIKLSMISEFSNLDIAFPDEIYDAEAMVAILVEDYQKVTQSILQAIEVCKAQNDEASINVLAERQYIQEKFAWMLKSSLAG
jgi:starvation-inducible DNA-binding protein